MSERMLIAPEFNDDEPVLPEAFKPYLDQIFMLRWHEDGVACFAAPHPDQKNMTFLECTFLCAYNLPTVLTHRKVGFYFDDIKHFENAEFKTKSLIPGDKNLINAQWSADYEKATRRGTAGFFNVLDSGGDLTWS